MSETVQRLISILSERLDVGLRAADIRPETPLMEDGLGLDSIAVVEFITLIEESFSMRFSEDDLNPETFANLKALAHFLDGQVAPH